MLNFTLKLYKVTAAGKNFLTEVGRHELQAASLKDAVAEGWTTQIPSFDDSDFALLFDDQNVAVWRYDADRT